ncbi:hypothetical protein MTR67_014848 [Solanum verrucosum]|uniref:Uncharacterized protein n=1 Tax=Solanum verrucosum TaxID=315347 RepID=A0AAF0QE48_SOLVR|nr:hypothetical protein MTR67_014848 [Solanum verrucosum]
MGDQLTATQWGFYPMRTKYSPKGRGCNECWLSEELAKRYSSYRYSSFACRRTLKNNLKGYVHIAATSKFCLLCRSSLEWERDKRRGEEENEVLLVVWVSPEAATVVADGRAAKEGEQTKALAMPLMEVNGD